MPQLISQRLSHRRLMLLLPHSIVLTARAAAAPQIKELAAFSETPPPSVTRHVFTPQDVEARQCVHLASVSQLVSASHFAIGCSGHTPPVHQRLDHIGPHDVLCLLHRLTAVRRVQAYQGSDGGRGLGRAGGRHGQHLRPMAGQQRQRRCAAVSTLPAAESHRCQTTTLILPPTCHSAACA